jgi:16S rRNA (guanine527-N7)-methyltransferase
MAGGKMDCLDTGLRELGVASTEKKALFEKYLAELLLFNPAYGLVSGNDRNEIIVRHILDSLAPWQHISSTLSIGSPDSAYREIADIGSGAGLPGIPLAIVMENCRFHLVEKMKRRVSFLQNTKAVLRLSNIAVVEKAVAKSFGGELCAGTVICRGFSAITDEIIDTFSDILEPDGTMIFYKGKREKIDRELESCKRLDHDKIRIIQYAPPFLHEERHLVMIKK